MTGSGRRRLRRLSAEDRRLWEQIAATAAPLKPVGSVEPSSATAIPAPDRAEPNATLPPPAISGLSDMPAPGMPGTLRPAGSARRAATHVTRAAPDAAPVGRPQAGLDRRTAERLRKGARTPDSRLDLHGMTAARAHDACLRFLGGALARGDRVVLVITGKGRRDAHGHMTGRGILRDSLPGWLRASPFGHSIVGLYQAHRRHGGEGAFYVYLKRRR